LPRDTGYDLLITPPPGFTAYYTLDGSDPRAIGGAINGTLYTMPIDISAGVTVRARTFDGTSWSALVEATFTVAAPADATNLRISEIHYNPPATLGVSDPQELEFIELFNPSANAVSLDGVQVTEFANTPYSFPNGLTLAGGERIIIAKNPTIFQQVYGNGVNLAPGGFGDASLSNGGERIALLGASGQAIQDFSFDDAAPWPLAADGGGSSLEIIDPFGDASSGANWRASYLAGGSPGTDGLPPAGTPGDSDEDDDVDGADFLAWQRGVGTPSGATRAMGDADGDQDVDAEDLALWKDNFGNPAAAPSTASSATADMRLSLTGSSRFLLPGQWITLESPYESKPRERRLARELAQDESFLETGDPPVTNPYSTDSASVTRMTDAISGGSIGISTADVDLVFELDEQLVTSAL
jgi:hypothetical protein